MKVYTTCAGCRRELAVTEELPNIHLGCPAPPATELDLLVADFVKAVIDGRDAEADKL